MFPGIPTDPDKRMRHGLGHLFLTASRQGACGLFFCVSRFRKQIPCIATHQLQLIQGITKPSHLHQVESACLICADVIELVHLLQYSLLSCHRAAADAHGVSLPRGCRYRPSSPDPMYVVMNFLHTVTHAARAHVFLNNCRSGSRRACFRCKSEAFLLTRESTVSKCQETLSHGRNSTDDCTKARSRLCTTDGHMKGTSSSASNRTASNQARGPPRVKPGVCGTLTRSDGSKLRTGAAEPCLRSGCVSAW
ncbi:hypothetical protein EV126DRAFT_49726 [Verticillium dahliae]|nr:hypothetical protein EV126DRAFT_49726 [Verticillium dahliae]